MKTMPRVYNPEIVKALEGLKVKKEQGALVNLKVKDIQTGMIAQEDKRLLSFLDTEKVPFVVPVSVRDTITEPSGYLSP